MENSGQGAPGDAQGARIGGKRKRLNIEERPSRWSERSIIQAIVHSYSNLIIRFYSIVRFRIIPTRFLNELSQYIPEQGRILDLGCGFGLFSIFFAMTHPNASFVGVDKSAERIRISRLSAQKLDVPNVEFLCNDARLIGNSMGRFDMVLTLDLMHHIPAIDGDRLIENVSQTLLLPEGRFLMKDVTTRPRGMLYFTFLLDLIMNPQASFFYRNTDAWMEALRKTGLSNVEKHYLWDILPYPHILLVAQKSTE
jgi:2-polyprenyl-3-methyl-5-hydroxy-6-metoxy-1,4-benzoquinol methylase